MALGQARYGFSFTSSISGVCIDSGRKLFLLAAANTAELFQNKNMRMKRGTPFQRWIKKLLLISPSVMQFTIYTVQFYCNSGF